MTTNENNERTKPHVSFSGENGNVFNLIAIARRALKQAGHHDEAKTLFAEVTAASTYAEALEILGTYVEFD